MQLYTLFKECSQVCTDSRKVPQDALFFALKGDNFDGNKYALSALEKGARYAVVSDPSLGEKKGCFLVKDTLVALQELARHHRRQFDIPFIGITGTNGKTTTKELLSTVLASQFQTCFTKGNLNNHIGVPLTLLSIPVGTEMAVIEMGANHIGEIDFLCKIAEPTHGIITNIGKAHLEGFGSQEGIKQTKSELYRFLAAHKGTAFVNVDQPFLQDLATGVENIVTYGTKNSKHQGKLLDAAPFVRFEMGGTTVETQLFGRYNLDNALTAMTIGLHFGIEPNKIKTALSSYVPANNRSQIVKRGNNVFYLDAYNANPTSMKVALESFGQQPQKSKIAILGDMLELGTYSEAEHLAVINQAKTLGLDCLLVGAEFEKVKEVTSKWFSDVTALKTWFEQQGFKETYFLVKGSRGIGLEKLIADN